MKMNNNNESQLVSINPANLEVLNSYSIFSEDKINKTLKKAHTSYLKWSLLPIKERCKLLKEIAKVIRKDIKKYATMATLEMGKPINQSINELKKCTLTLDYYAKEGAKMLQDETIKTEFSKSYVTYQPLGIILAIMPWNFPFWQVFRAMAPILVSGNTMLLKHASNVSGCALMIEDILKKAKAPLGIFQTLLISSKQVSQIIAAQNVAAVTFTGSTEVGKKVAATAASHLKKQVLELGGNDAYVVLEDADINHAVRVCYEARFINTGQSCLAAKRFIVVQKHYKEFEEKMLSLISATTYGNPLNTNAQLGPMARIDLREELHQQVISSVKKGAKLLHGGFIPKENGAYYPATLLSNAKKNMPAYNEEIFGPVGVIIKAKDTNDALRIANDSNFGLGATIFSKNKKESELIARNSLNAGNCFVNAAVHSDPRLPFGGIKNSGYGRELSSYAIREFVNIKTVVVS